MKLIVGLGNPGDEYHGTRHNVGFLALDYLLQSVLVFTSETQFKSKICKKNDTWFVKPETFMNNSGIAVQAICKFYKLNPSTDLLVVHDDTDIRFGEIREVQDSSSAGHNGVQSIIDQLGTKDFHRIRIGIETRENRSEKPTDAFVLEFFTSTEMRILLESLFPKVAVMIRQFAGLPLV